MQTLSKTNAIEEFYSLVMEGVKAWKKAGEIVAKQVDVDPEFPDKIHDAHPEISVDFVLAFDRIGRRLLHPDLLMDDSPGTCRLRELPFDVQAKHLTKPVQLLVVNGNKYDELSVDVRNLTAAQARQVFSKSGVRSIAAQRAWLEDKNAKQSVPSDEPYRIVGRKLIVMEPTSFSPKQLAQFLANME